MAAVRADMAINAMFGDLYPWCGHIKNLTFAQKVGHAVYCKNTSATRTFMRFVGNDMVGVFNLAQRLPLVSLLTAGLFLAFAAQAAGARLFLQPITRWRLGTVGTVKPDLPFKLGNTSLQRPDLLALHGNDFKQFVDVISHAPLIQKKIHSARWRK